MGVEDAEKRDRELGVVKPELKTGEENIV